MEWKIPLSDIDFDQKEVNAAVKVIKSRWLTMGAVTQEFEKAFARYLGVKHALAVTNCTAALHMANQVLGIGRGDEVICPSLTFVATANSILYTGAKPVFADITSLDDLNISPESILERITPRTKAITVVHYGGYPCDMSKIMEIARKYKLYVIEDVAHAIGAEYNGKKCGAIGDIGCFSFFSNKNMTTGEGGMITTNNDKLAEKLRKIRSHGMTTLTWDRHKGHAFSYDVVELGYNYRIDEIRSALGLVQLRKLESNNRKRRELVKIYRKALEGVKNISIPFSRYYGKSAFHLFVILAKNIQNRKRLMRDLQKNGIQTSIHYPPIHSFKFYRERFSCREGSLSLTERVGGSIITLPLYPGLNSKDVYSIKDKIKIYN